MNPGGHPAGENWQFKKGITSTELAVTLLIFAVAQLTLFILMDSNSRAPNYLKSWNALRNRAYLGQVTVF